MEEGGTEWVPVVEFDGVEYVVDIKNKGFAQLQDPTEIVAFHSDEGRDSLSLYSLSDMKPLLHVTIHLLSFPLRMRLPSRLPSP